MLHVTLAPADFRARFDTAARRVRSALAARRVLDGAAAGAVAGALLASAGLALGRVLPWPFSALLAAAGAAFGAVLGLRERWDDASVALFLDARLTRDESISTALERGATEDELGAHTMRRASAALSSSERARVRPKVLRRVHAALPLALALAAGARFLPKPAEPAPGGAHVHREKPAELVGLRSVEALRDLPARTDDEKRTLEALATAAKRLEDQAARGIDRRDALDALAKLESGVDAERGRLADAKNRAGLDAAVRALSRHPETEAAARALGNADATALDRATQRMADQVERASRKAARRALEEAGRAAADRGATEVAVALDEQRRLLERRVAENDALRELAKWLGDGLGDDGRRALARLDRGDGSEKLALAEALAKALAQMSPEQRRKIAEALRKAASDVQDGRAMTRAELERLARDLSSPEGEARLADALRSMAEGGQSEEAARERALALASAGIADAARSLGAGNGQTGGQGDPANDASGRSAGDGPGHAAHHGETEAVAGSSLPARAGGPSAGGIPIGEAPGRSAPGAVEIARVRGTGALGAAMPNAVGAVEHADVPKEYRDQVRRYFSP
jgi:hypothetical protein